MEQIGDINIKILSYNCIVDYSNIFITINILELIVVIFILLFPNKKIGRNLQYVFTVVFLWG